MNDETRRAHELIARADEMLAARPRFVADDWAARSPDVSDPAALRAWLAELPDEPAPETPFERWKRETEEEAKRQAEAREKEAEERASKRREAFAAAASQRKPARAQPRTSQAPAWMQPASASFVIKSDIGPTMIRKVIRFREPGDSDD